MSSRYDEDRIESYEEWNHGLDCSLKYLVRIDELQNELIHLCIGMIIDGMC